MLRIDVNVPDNDAFGYSIPPDNPFLGASIARDEIWAFGLRNPWRYSFDDVSRGGTGALVIGDVGQSSREEIDYEPRGAGGRNYGWRNREGTRDNVTSRPLFSTADGSDLRLRTQRRHLGNGRIRLSRHAAGRRLSRTIFLRRLLGARLVARARHRRLRRSARVGLTRAHSRARRQRGARQHQLVRRRRRRRDLYRESFRRQDRSHHRAAYRPAGADGSQDHQTVAGCMGAIGARGARACAEVRAWRREVRGVRRKSRSFARSRSSAIRRARRRTS